MCLQAGHNRWPIEDCFLRCKQEVGLDDYEVRGWRGWHHHMTLAMLALWFLVLQKRRLGGKITETGRTLPDMRRLLSSSPPKSRPNRNGA
jgi:SRSO17 transposase